jgi:GNAT superfamily N-acetyltransferase
MKISKAQSENLREILILQKLCFRQEAEIYADFSIPPLRQSYEELLEECGHKLVLKAVANRLIVGSVRACQENHTCYIGRLVVHPDYQNKGIGARLMNAIEGEFPGVKRFELFTGFKSEKNIYLYQKLGYRVYKKQRTAGAPDIVFMEKQNNPVKK